jgi:hypothetical protein
VKFDLRIIMICLLPIFSTVRTVILIATIHTNTQQTMEGSSSEPILISDEESLPDAPAASSAIPSSPDMSLGHSQSHNQNNDHSSSSARPSSALSDNSFDLSFTQTKLRGRKIGDGAGTKRKAVEELSDNKHTKRGRVRKEQMNELESEIERAKNADRQAKTRARKTVLQTAEYKTADHATQKRLLEEAEIKMMDKRYVAIIVTI